MSGNSLADGLTVYVGVCNPGDDSHSFICDGVSSCLAARRLGAKPRRSAKADIGLAARTARG